MPPLELQDRFIGLIEPMYQQIDAINLAVDELKSTRDALLPRLISGKLSVDALDIRFPPGMVTAGA
jgi:type I restriction enzyme S subunit